MKPFYLVAVFLAVSACGTSYKQTTIQPAHTTLDSTLTVLVTVPVDGSYGGRKYVSSGQMTAEIVRSAFLRVGPRTDIASSCTADCLVQARAGGYGYLVKPEILHWEDRATEWSGISDKAEVRLSLYDVASGEVIGSQVISGKSSIWTFGGDHPQDLLPTPTTDYIRSLYN